MFPAKVPAAQTVQAVAPITRRGKGAGPTNPDTFTLIAVLFRKSEELFRKSEEFVPLLPNVLLETSEGKAGTEPGGQMAQDEAPEYCEYNPAAVQREHDVAPTRPL